MLMRDSVVVGKNYKETDFGKGLKNVAEDFLIQIGKAEIAYLSQIETLAEEHGITEEKRQEAYGVLLNPFLAEGLQYSDKIRKEVEFLRKRVETAEKKYRKAKNKILKLIS